MASAVGPSKEPFEGTLETESLISFRGALPANATAFDEIASRTPVQGQAGNLGSPVVPFCLFFLFGFPY